MNYSHNRMALLSASVTLALMPLLTGCQDEDFGYTAEQIKYEKAYHDIFGDMPADKNWDLSSNQNYYDPDRKSNQTRAYNGVTPDGTLDEGRDGEYQVLSDYWQVPNDLFSWMKDALLEGKDNRYLGSNFVLQLPDNDFAIIPIFQGQSSIMSELEIKINGYGIKTIWQRSQNIQVQDADKQKSNADPEGWMNVGYYEGYTSYKQDQMKKEGDATIHDGEKHLEDLPMYPSFTDDADAVRSKPIYFRSKDRIAKQDNGFMYLSLHNIDKAWANWDSYNTRWDEENTWTTIGHRLTSVNPSGHMLALNVPSYIKLDATNLPDICEDRVTKPSQAILIACEDANGTSTDHDVNDVAFLIIGYPNAPTIVPTTQVIEKRYMCEDLGGTYDYDFNDIVIDCKQVQKYEIVTSTTDLNSYEEGVADQINITNMQKVGCPVQTAKVSRLCGTIPIQVRIGDFMFPKIKDPSSTDGKYSTRTGLINDPYNNYCNGNHNSCSCDNHADWSTSPNQMSHTNFTRAAEYKTTEGWNPNEEQIIPCHTWDPSTNNIVIYADWGYKKQMYHASDVTDWQTKKENNPFPSNSLDFADFANGKKFAVTFPKSGEYPYIIATDVDVPWMTEGKHIPSSWVNGDFSDKTNADVVGNSFYMEGYPSSDGEGYIWSGDVTGIANRTSVKILPNTAEMAAIAESQDGGRNYVLLHVYCSAPIGETGLISLCSAQTGLPLSSSNPDNYMALPLSQRVHNTYVGVDGLSCATIYLTQAEWQTVRSQGLEIVSRTNGLHIKKITTARPCIYDNGSVKRDVNNAVLVDPGFTININRAEMAKQVTDGQYWGCVMSDESQRVLGADDNAARVLVPFESAKFISGTRVELTARGAQGYKLQRWNGDLPNDATNTDNPLVYSYTASSANDSRTYNIYPTFEKAQDPNLHLEDGSHEVSITLVNNSNTYRMPMLSLNMEHTVDVYGLNTSIVSAVASKDAEKHYLTFTPVSAGETSFIIYQREGKNNDYGVSGELKINVKVIEESEIPTGGTDLASWMIYEWNNGTRDAYIVNKVDNSDGHIKVIKNEAVTSRYGNNDPIFGHVNGHYRQYADFPQAEALVVEVTSGDIEVHLNKQWGEGQYAAFNGSRLIVSTKQNTEYCKAIYNGTGGAMKYIIDLAAIRQRYGYVHLNSICSFDGAPATVSSMKVVGDYSPLRARWDDMEAKISSAATSLTVNDIYEWSDASANATTNGKPGNANERYLWKDSEHHTAAKGEVICGDTWTLYNNYVDLSKATVIVATVPADGCEIEFLFNKQLGEGDNRNWNGEVVSVRPGTNLRHYCAVVKDGSNYQYVIDADGLKNELGVNYLHLNNIRVPYYNADSYDTYIISLKTDVYSNPSFSFNLTSVRDDQYLKIDQINGEDIWNKVLAGGAKDYSNGIQFKVKLGYGVVDFYFMNKEGEGDIGASYKKQVKSSSAWVDCSFNDTTRELTWTMSKSDFDTYFLANHSNIYIGGNAPHASEVFVTLP